MTTRTEIQEWLERGKANDATHMFVITDTFDWDDYPVYVTASAEEAQKKAAAYPRQMQKLTEVYRLDRDLDAQLSEHRAFNF